MIVRDIMSQPRHHGDAGDIDPGRGALMRDNHISGVSGSEGRRVDRYRHRKWI
ncbi:MAG: hypothetical protein R2873_28350 [Caldilineaceae bacterium]